MLSRSTLELFYPLHRFEILEKHKGRLDPYLAAALIRQESGFNERARSPAGAMGLMQLMPATARRMERVSRLELFDPRTNVRLGVRYFAGLLDRFGGDAELALAGYNAGPDRVDQWLKRYPVANRALFVDLIPFRETRDYVSFIARNYYWYQALYGMGAPEGRVTQLDQSKILEKSGQWFPQFKGL
jgi:soluble lytic murein transglycosylase